MQTPQHEVAVNHALPSSDEGLVDRSHQTIMQMIGKLEEDEKADWPGHLAEIVHAYNTTHSAVTGYSLHYLMFGCWPRLPVNFYFPTLRSAEDPKQVASTKHVDEYIVAVQDCYRATLQEAQAQSTVIQVMCSGHGCLPG